MRALTSRQLRGALDYTCLELGGMLRHFHLQTDLFRDVTLNTEVSDDSALRIVQTNVVALDIDRRAVEPTLVSLEMQLATVEELAPDTTAAPRDRAGRSHAVSARRSPLAWRAYCANMASFTFVMRWCANT